MKSLRLIPLTACLIGGPCLADNISDIVQIGASHNAEVHEAGDSHSSKIRQEGTDHHAKAIQGSGIEISGSSSVILQTGAENWAEVVQGGSSAYVRQEGEGNHASVEQMASLLPYSATIEQIGLENDATVRQVLAAWGSLEATIQ